MVVVYKGYVLLLQGNNVQTKLHLFFLIEAYFTVYGAYVIHFYLFKRIIHVKVRVPLYSRASLSPFYGFQICRIVLIK